MGAQEFLPAVMPETSGEPEVLTGTVIAHGEAEAAGVFVIAPGQTHEDEPDAAVVVPQGRHYEPRHAGGAKARWPELHRPVPRHAAMRRGLSRAAFELMTRKQTSRVAGHVALSSAELQDVSPELVHHA